MLSRISPYGNMVAAIATVVSCDIAFGLTYQLLPLILHAQGVPAWLIGVNAAMGPLGLLMAGPFLPNMIHKFGAKRLVYTAILTIILVLFGFALRLPFFLWFPLRFCLGIAIGMLFTVSEVWIINASTENNRGLVMGLYTSALSISFAVGPLIVPYTGINGWLPWGLAMVCVTCSFVPLMVVNVSGDSTEKPHGFIEAFRRAPILYAAIATAAIFDNILISFFTIYGMGRGLSLSNASEILGLAIVSGSLMFFLLGMLGDRFGRNRVVVICVGLTILNAALLTVLITTPFALAHTILLITAAFGIYVLSLAIVGDVFKGPDVVAGSAGVAAMWGFGGLIGPPAAGAAIDAFGFNAMPVTIMVLYAILFAALMLNGGKLVRQTEIDRP
jgi:MFS family permease